MPVVSLRPSADVSVTDWETGGGSGSNLYAEIDETTVSSTDYIATEGGTAKFELTNPSAGIAAATMRVRFRKDGDDEANLTVRLLQNNYPTTWNPADKSSNIALSGGDLIATVGNDEYAGVRTIASYSSGKKYAEITINPLSGIFFYTVGISNSAHSLTTPLGYYENGVGWRSDGLVMLDGATLDTIGDYSDGDEVISLAIDFDNQKLWARPLPDTNWNDDVIANQNPATNTGGISFSDIEAGPYFLTIVSYSQVGDVITLNTGMTEYAGEVPSGFTNWSAGEATVAEWEYTDIADTDFDDEVALTSPQFALITDPSDLRVEFEATVDAGAAYSSEMQQFYDRTTGLDSTHLDAYEALIDGLVADGVWSKIQVIYVFAAPDTTTALLNLKTSASFNPATTSGAITFTADVGYSGEATTTKHVNTGYNNSTHGSQNDQHIMVWNNTNATQNASIMGCRVAGTDNQSDIYPKYAGGKHYIRVNSDVGHDGVAVGNPIGMLLGSRDNGSDYDFYFNGAAVTGSPFAEISAAPANLNVYVCAVNIDGTAESGDWQCRAASLGAALTAGEAADYYTHLAAYMAAIDA